MAELRSVRGRIRFLVPNFIAGVIQLSFLQILVGGSGSRRSHERCRETIIHLYLHKYKDDCLVVVVVVDEDDGLVGAILVNGRKEHQEN